MLSESKSSFCQKGFRDVEHGVIRAPAREFREPVPKKRFGGADGTLGLS
jgi:hypothetical protein